MSRIIREVEINDPHWTNTWLTVDAEGVVRIQQGDDLIILSSVGVEQLVEALASGPVA